MATNDKEGAGEEGRPAKKTTRKRAPSARKRASKAVSAAQQTGVPTVDQEPQVQTAYDVKEIHRSLTGFTDDDLKQIPIVAEGAHLDQGATYIDLSEERPTETKVNAGVIARAGHYWVPKNRVPYTIWNRLIGEAKPGQEASGATDRSASDFSTAGAAMGDQPTTRRETGGDTGSGADDAERAAQSAADELKSWMDTRQEDRDQPREVL